MIIDLDNFKAINDTFGHMFGDTVLTEVAVRLQKLFRIDDIVSRVGGDEFLVYLSRLPDPALLLERASNLVAAMQNILADDLCQHSLSCSVGIAYFPRDAANFLDLYQCCDRALYSATARGKNQYALYDKKSMEMIFNTERQQIETANTRIESDEVYDFETAVMIQQASRKLYQEEDTDSVINSILELIGRKYDVSRTYIFKDCREGA